MTPWGVQPDGTTLTPAPGMLVAYQQPGDTAIFWGIVAESSDFCARYERDEADGYYPEDVIQGPHFTHLAPAPTPGGLWDALQGLREVADYTGYYGYQNWESGRICMARLNYKPEIEYHTYVVNTCTAKVLPRTYEAHMRDMQKFGALLAYCAQEGW